MKRRYLPLPEHGSKPGRINRQDSKRAVLVALVAAISAFLVSVSGDSETLDLGGWETVAIAGIAAVVEAIRRWLTDNSIETVQRPARPTKEGDNGNGNH